MNFFGLILFVLLSAATAFSQTPKPASKAAPAKPKTQTTSNTKAAGKAKQSTAKPSTAGKKPSADVAKPAPTAAKKPDERSEWEKAVGITDLSERIKALRKFTQQFPRSSRLSEAAAMISASEAALAADKLAAGDLKGAFDLYSASIADAPTPIPDQTFTEVYVKLPAEFFFKAGRAEGLRLAELLESKAASRAPQLLDIANFYLGIEDGSSAKRIAEQAIKLEPSSAAAYQVLGLADRVDFLLEESAAAYAKALELDPESITARRGLAEMKRALGDPVEAASLYREILERSPNNYPARTGLVLSLFDSDKKAEAESALSEALASNPSNVVLLAGAAYWYAGRGDGDAAVNYAQKAIAADARFIWSHIALARGLLVKGDLTGAEKTLLAARRYGNFPTLEYELATVRASAGYFREAAEELAKNFSVKDGVVTLKLGGRLSRESRNITELVGLERRASIFAPTAADNPENAARLTALLALQQELTSKKPDPDAAARAALDFTLGDDPMKVHRQIFAASRLLEKDIAVAAAAEITRGASANIEAGLSVPQPAVAVMANELYENRSLAAVRGEYLNVPDVSKATLSAILRGQVEELTGLAALHENNTDEAVIRLRRAVSVLPADSAWWRSGMWRLAGALARSGKEAEALETYYRHYRSSGPNGFRYRIIAALYQKVNGSTDGLEAKIGPDPEPSVATSLIAQAAAPTPETTPVPVPEAAAAASPSPSATPDLPISVPVATPEPAATPAVPANIPIATPPPTPVESPSPSPTAEASPVPSPVESPTPPTVAEIIPVPTPTAEQTQVPTPSPAPAGSPEPSPSRNPLADLLPPVVILIPKTSTSPAPAESPQATPSPTAAPASEAPQASPSPTPAETLARVEPSPSIEPSAAASPEPSPAPTPTGTDAAPDRRRFAEFKPAVKACTLTASEQTINIRQDGGDLAVIIGRDDDADLEGLTAASSSPENVSVRREIIAGVKARALFVVRSVSSRSGIYTIVFELPCGKKELQVKVN